MHRATTVLLIPQSYLNSIYVIMHGVGLMMFKHVKCTEPTPGKMTYIEIKYDFECDWKVDWLKK